MSYYPETMEVRSKPRERQLALTRLREKIRPELLKITDPEAVLAISHGELFKQVSYILDEILGRYAFSLSIQETNEMAHTLSNELIAACRAKPTPETIN